MSAERLAATVLWTELVQAMRKDGIDVPDQAGPETSAYALRVARDAFGLEARIPAGVSEVTRQLIERDAHGQRKYGTSLDRTDLNLGDWLQHQAEELMDGAGYALAAKREYERLVAERDALQERLDSIENATLEARTRG